jgi:hypothetical protein
VAEQLGLFDYDEQGNPTPRALPPPPPPPPPTGGAAPPPPPPRRPGAPTGPDFDGMTYDPMHDYDRLSTQLRDVWDRLTADPERWWTLSELCGDIEFLTTHHHTEAAVSARLRDLRKPKFGRYTVQRKPGGRGLFRYRLDPIHYRARQAAQQKEQP